MEGTEEEEHSLKPKSQKLDEESFSTCEWSAAVNTQRREAGKNVS